MLSLAAAPVVAEPAGQAKKKARISNKPAPKNSKKQQKKEEITSTSEYRKLKQAIEHVYKKKAKTIAATAELQKAHNEEQSAHQHLLSLINQLPEKGIDPVEYIAAVSAAMTPPATPPTLTGSSASTFTTPATPTPTYTESQ